MNTYAQNTVGIAFPVIHMINTRTRAICGHRLTPSAIRSDVVDRRFDRDATLCGYCANEARDRAIALFDAANSLEQRAMRHTAEINVDDVVRGVPASHEAVLESFAMWLEVEALRRDARSMHYVAR